MTTETTETTEQTQALQAENPDPKLEMEQTRLGLEKASLRQMELQNERTALENERVALDNAAIRAAQQQQAQEPQAPLNINIGPESERTVIPEQPKGPGGAPVPRAPLGADKVPPKQGDEVRVTCRSGATIRATGQKCQGKIQKIQGIIDPGGGITGGGGRRVIYVCQTCNQPWNVTY